MGDLIRLGAISFRRSSLGCRSEQRAVPQPAVSANKDKLASGVAEWASGCEGECGPGNEAEEQPSPGAIGGRWAAARRWMGKEAQAGWQSAFAFYIYIHSTARMGIADVKIAGRCGGEIRVEGEVYTSAVEDERWCSRVRSGRQVRMKLGGAREEGGGREGGVLERRCERIRAMRAYEGTYHGIAQQAEQSMRCNTKRVRYIRMASGDVVDGDGSGCRYIKIASHTYT